MRRMWQVLAIVAILWVSVGSAPLAHAQSQSQSQSQSGSDKVSTTKIKGIVTSSGSLVLGGTHRAGDAMRNARPDR